MFKVFTASKILLATVSVCFIASAASAQQQKITDFVLFGGQGKTSTNVIANPPAPGLSVNIASSVIVTGGNIGSYNLIKTAGTSTLNTNLNSGGTINLANSSTINGNITSQNQYNTTGNILQVGSNANVKYNIDVNGDIYISGGQVGGNVTHPYGTKYTGPKPGGKEFIATPKIPTLPQFPPITNFTATGTVDILYSKTIAPGQYRNMTLNGNQKVTFNGPGDYYFKSIHNKNANTFEFDFKNAATGNIRIFVDGDVELDKSSSSLKNGGAASRIFMEVHGTGATCSSKSFSFNISNGTTCTTWLGTVWAPHAGISIGSGSGLSRITGALWSASQVNVQANSTINFEPYPLQPGDGLIIPGYQSPPGGKSTDLIGPELISLCQTFSTGLVPSTDIYRIVDSMVLIEVVANAGYYNNALTRLRDVYGMRDFVNNGLNSLIITGKIPVLQLCPLNNDAQLKIYINSCRPIYPPVTNTGLANTGGDTSMHSNIVREAFHLTGNGIKVGVLSDGFNTIPGNPAGIDVANGDLPGAGDTSNPTPVNVLLDYPYGRSTDEGRAMLQIIHDVAPKAILDFRTGFVSEGDFAQGINQLQQDGCKVIADDITYITTPFFKDGLAAKAVNNVKALGVSYFSAAGNFGSKSYEAVFNPTVAPNGIIGQAHNFGGGDIFQNDSLQAGSYTLVMQWQDSIYSLGQGGAQNDFDIYLVNDDGSLLFGMNRPNIGADPLEVLTFVVKANTRTNIMVVRAAGSTPNVRFKFIVYRGELKFNEFANGTSTLVGQANAAGAMAVAAARYNKTPAYGVSPALIETFSSTGGTPVYGVIRNKPDFTAPDGGNTTVNFGSLDVEGDGIPNFFGTSAATPHAAGVAALVLEGKQRFYNKVLEPDSIRTILSNTALDMATPGFDNTSGYGLIQADAAVSSFAAPTPRLDSFIIQNPGTVIPGKTTFTVTLRGKYFSNSSYVTLRGKKIATQIVNSSEATALIDPFLGNPPVQVYTPPITPSGLDGSYSNAIYFLSPIRKKVTVIADNKTKNYGEKLPAFTAHVLVNNVPLDSTSLSLPELKLDTIVYTTPATSTSDVGLYFIRPSFKILSPTDSLVFELYDYTFTDGVLFNNKQQLLITPRDTTFVYGGKISGFNFNYSYKDSLIPTAERSTFLTNIGIAHNSTINNNVVGFVDGKTIINGRVLTDADLNNMGVMASGKSIINARNIVNSKSIVNGVVINDTTKVVDLAVQSIFNYQLDSSSSPLVNAKNIVNARTIVNGKSIVNGTAEVNGKNIINGTTILNSNSVGDTSNQNVVVIIDQTDVPDQRNVLSDLKSVNMITGNTVGNATIVPAAMLSENFEIRYGLGHVKITPAQLAVKARDTAINQGDPLPKFTSDITGLQNGDTVVSGPVYTVSPICNGSNAGSYTITPSRLVTSCADCYITTYIPGHLYINPKGKNAKNLKPYLVCVDTLINDPSGLKYMATFGCNNDNNTTVYIPRGSNNNLSGTGAATALGALPEYFLPGGDNTAQIKFNGSKLTWIVTSYNSSQKTAVAQDASSTSSRCKKLNVVAADISAPAIGASAISQPKASVSPNPTTGRFVLSAGKQIFSEKEIYITDATGKQYTFTANKISSNSVEIILGDNLSKGVYFVHAKVDGLYKVFSIVKF